MLGRAMAVGFVAATALVCASASNASPMTLDSKTADRVTCIEPLEPCGPEIVLGTASWFNGPVDIIGNSSGAGICIEYRHTERSFGNCPAKIETDDGGPIQLSRIAASGLGEGPVFTEVSGPVSPAVASAQIRYRSGGKQHRVAAFVAQVNGAELTQVGETAPFGLVEATVRGCVRARRFRAVAFDASGQRLGKSRLTRVKVDCENAEQGGESVSGSRISGAAERPAEALVECDDSLPPCGPPVLLGTKRFYDGPARIVGYSSAVGPCIETQFRGGAGQQCGVDPELPLASSSIALVSQYGMPGAPGGGETSDYGLVRPKVAEVALKYKLDGKSLVKDTLVAQIAGKDVKKIGAKEPFGIFFASVRGCVPTGSLRAIAYDKAGKRVGQDGFISGAPVPCMGYPK